MSGVDYISQMSCIKQNYKKKKRKKGKIMISSWMPTLENLQLDFSSNIPLDEAGRSA